MRYSIIYIGTSNLRIYQRTGKNVFRWEKLNVEHVRNSAHTTEFLAFGEAVNIYIIYLMFYLSRQHVKGKLFKYSYKFTFNNDFMMKMGSYILV